MASRSGPNTGPRVTNTGWAPGRCSSAARCLGRGRRPPGWSVTERPRTVLTRRPGGTAATACAGGRGQLLHTLEEPRHRGAGTRTPRGCGSVAGRPPCVDTHPSGIRPSRTRRSHLRRAVVVSGAVTVALATAAPAWGEPPLEVSEHI